MTVNTTLDHNAVDESGLSEHEATLRLTADGPNLLPNQGRHGLSAIMWSVIREPMFLLLVGAGVLYLVIGEPRDAALLLGFVFVIMGITIMQARRTERALDALRDLSSPHAVVIRDAVRRRIPAGQVVRGDLIQLAEGERIPADAVIRQGTSLSVDESLLTGESVPVGKKPSTSIARLERPGGDNLSSVYSGTLVTAGQSVAEVLATGVRTELGRIGKSLGEVKSERTRLQQETGRLVRNLALVGIFLCCVVVVVYALTRGGDGASWKHGLLAGITMAMAVLPEEFPVVLTIFFAFGAWRISHIRVLTRHMPAIETLGAATVLCTDKTGTLTENKMSVVKIVIDGRHTELGRGTTAYASDIQALMEVAVLACKADPFDPMESAIHAGGAVVMPGIKDLLRTWTLEREYPLTPELLAVTHVWNQGNGQAPVIASKGAPEAIIDLCGLSSAQRDVVLQQVTALAAEGLRVLAVARGTESVEHLPSQHHDLPVGFLGLIGLADPLRANVPAAVLECHTAGIRVIMITGDYPATAQSIARQAGITNPGAVLSGVDLESMSDEELANNIRSIQVFARVAPQQKLRIVQALRANHDIVAMTGDGVNDAPALKAADIGIAMGGRGSDVARESADLVLLDDDFASIVAAVKMGRRIYDNIKKASNFILAVHVPIAGLSILPVFVPGWPLLLLPVHVVFLELVIDPSCTLIFEAEKAEPDLMSRPPRDPQERLFSWKSIAVGVFQGASSLAMCIGIFVYARAEHADDAARTLMFIALVGSILAIIVTNRSRTRNLIDTLRTPNSAQWWVILATSVTLTIVLTVPFARSLLHVAQLHVGDVVISVAAGVLCVCWIEVLKVLRRHRQDATP